MADLCFGLVMTLIFGLMMTEIDLIDQWVEECKIWFSVWDWEDIDLVGCFLNCKISVPNVFAERILHLRHLKNDSVSLALICTYLFWWFIFYLSLNTLGGLLPTFIAVYPVSQLILFCFQLLVFLITEDLVSGWFLLAMYVAYTAREHQQKNFCQAGTD